MSNIKTIYASSVAALDSNVYTGGGTDDTAALQAVLDLALTDGGVHLIMDGASLVTTLYVHSNTTIECLSGDCGFFQAPHTDFAIVTNSNWHRSEMLTRNVTLIGGTYNQDCRNQAHDIPSRPEFVGVNCYDERHLSHPMHGICGMVFAGVENLLVRDVTILDFRTYAFFLCNFKRATIDHVWLDLPNRMQAQNQDGFHFWGPGQFLTVRDCGGKVGDDFMNIGPDEGDLCSSITDVLVDGIFHDEADQSIRILSRGTGAVDRVTIRNVQGSYRSFGFYINSWFPDTTAGNFGDIFIENINLTHTAPNYDYRPPMLFSVGGDIRCLTLKNIRHEHPIDARAIGEFGLPFHSTTPLTAEHFEYPAGQPPVLRNLIIDGLTVIENGQSDDMEQLQVFGRIGNMIVRNVTAIKESGVPRSGKLISVKPYAHVDNLVLDSVLSVGMDTLIEGKESADRVVENNITAL